MARTWVLTTAERNRLETLRLTTEHVDVFRNATIILLTAEQWAKATIAAALGCSASTVDRVRRLYCQQGLAGLRPVKPPGRPPVVSADYRQALCQAVQTDPRTLGYAFTVWSAPRLNTYLRQLTGVSLSDGHVRHLLQHEGFSVHRPKHTLRGKRDEQAHAEAKEALRRLKKNPATGH